eukprot:12392851-Alexandrium_andersonii.AAC.1
MGAGKDTNDSTAATSGMVLEGSILSPRSKPKLGMSRTSDNPLEELEVALLSYASASRNNSYVSLCTTTNLSHKLQASE